MGWKMILVLFLLSVSLVSGELFFFYDEEIYTVKKFFNPLMHEEVFSTLHDSDLGIETDEQEQEIERAVEIAITEKGFTPEKVEIKRNQTVVWKNERKKLSALLMGMREISAMRQSLKPGERFSYVFEKPGKYVYVDGIVIGYQGEIVVVR